MKLSQDEMQERRETIIQTAFNLFCERGIEHVPVSVIAKAANVGETTVYRYFENKPVLVLETFIKLWDLIMERVVESVEKNNDYHVLNGYQQIRVWLDSFRQLYQNNADFILFSYEAKLYLLRHGVRLNQFQQDALMQAIKKPCMSALEKGKADGSIPVKQRDNEDLFYAIWGAVRGYIVKIVIYDSLYEGESPWESRYEVMEHGILSSLESGWGLPEGQ